jgi:hypothetical protein
LLIDKTVTSEEKLAELLGYDEIRYKPFKSRAAVGVILPSDSYEKRYAF